MLLTLTSPGYGGKYNKYGVDTTALYAERLVPAGPPAAIGWRVDLSGNIHATGIDVNIEILWRPPSKYGPAQFGVFVTPAMGLSAPPGLGVGGSTGPVVVIGLTDLNEYLGLSASIGGSIKLAGVGLEADVSTGTTGKAYYIGGGTGGELNVYGNFGRTFGHVWGTR